MVVLDADVNCNGARVREREVQGVRSANSQEVYHRDGTVFTQQGAKHDRAEVEGSIWR